MSLIKEEIKNILVVRNDRFGEFLLNIPALRALREKFTHARIILVTDPYVKELAECVLFVDEVIAWERGGQGLKEKIIFLNSLKKKDFNIAIMLNPSKEFNILTYLTRIPIRAGYDRKCGFLLTHKIRDKKYLGDKHEIEYNLDLVNLLGAKTINEELTLNIDDSVIDGLLKEFNLKATSNFVALHPWTSDPSKQWPIVNFSALAKRLMYELGVNIVVIGGKAELERDQEYFGYFDNKLINLTGKTTLTQLAALLKKSQLLISCDSGPVHLACAVGTPVIAIFRNDLPGKSPKRWGPSGQGHTVIEKNRLSDITVDEVLYKIKEKLNK